MNDVPSNWHHTAENIAITECNFLPSQFSQQDNLQQDNLRFKNVQCKNAVFSLHKTIILKDILATYMSMKKQ